MLFPFFPLWAVLPYVWTRMRYERALAVRAGADGVTVMAQDSVRFHPWAELEVVKPLRGLRFAGNCWVPVYFLSAPADALDLSRYFLRRADPSARQRRPDWAAAWRLFRFFIGAAVVGELFLWMVGRLLAPFGVNVPTGRLLLMSVLICLLLGLQAWARIRERDSSQRKRRQLRRKRAVRAITAPGSHSAT
jgi:hypothetical protein